LRVKSILIEKDWSEPQWRKRFSMIVLKALVTLPTVTLAIVREVLRDATTCGAMTQALGIGDGVVVSKAAGNKVLEMIGTVIVFSPTAVLLAPSRVSAVTGPDPAVTAEVAPAVEAPESVTASVTALVATADIVGPKAILASVEMEDREHPELKMSCCVDSSDMAAVRRSLW
jgi:hypothetical protein